MKNVSRRSFVGNFLLGLPLVSLFGKTAESEVSRKKGLSSFQSAIKVELDNINKHLSSVVTHRVSLRRRRHQSVTAEYIKGVLCEAVAVLDKRLEDFRVVDISFGANDFGQVVYETKLKFGEHTTKLLQSQFMFSIYGKSGDVVWIRHVDNDTFHTIHVGCGKPSGMVWIH